LIHGAARVLAMMQRHADRAAASAANKAQHAAEHRRRDTQAPRKPDLPRCGARCRSKGGAPCVAPVVVCVFVNERGDIWRVVRNRCRMHGGLSTGPRTAEGRQRCAEAGRRGAAERWRRWRIARWE